MNTGEPGRVWAVWLIGGLVANFAWEMLQMPLYGGLKDGS